MYYIILHNMFILFKNKFIVTQYQLNLMIQNFILIKIIYFTIL